MRLLDQNIVRSCAIRALVVMVLISATSVMSSQQAVIDARRMSKENAIKAYRDAVNEALNDRGGTAILDLHITLIIDGRAGFDPGFLRLPESIRRVRVNIDLIVFGASTVNPKTISVNNFELNDPRRLHEVRQMTTLR